MDSQLQKLESLVERLEKLTLKSENGQQSDSASIPQITEDLMKIINQFKTSFLPICKTIGKDCEAASKILIERFERIALLSGFPGICKEPSKEQLSDFLKPILKKLPLPPRDLQENPIKSIEAAFDFCNYIIQNQPLDYLKEIHGQVNYYNNRVRLNNEIPGNKDFADQLHLFMQNLIKVISEYYENRRIQYKGKGEFGSSTQKAVQEEAIVKKAEISAVAPVQAKIQVKKEPVKFFDAGKKCYFYENVENETIQLEVNNMESVSLYNCKRFNLIVTGKLNMASVLQCNQSSLIVDSVISEISILKVNSLNIEVKKGAQTINIENSEGVKVFLSDQAITADVILFCSSDVKIIQNGGEEDKEHYLPTHFLYKVIDGKLVVKEVEMEGE